jgi:hypothetical protein
MESANKGNSARSASQKRGARVNSDSATTNGPWMPVGDGYRIDRIELAARSMSRAGSTPK